MPPDSAGTANALLTGHKTRSGVVGVSHAVTKHDCVASKMESNRLNSIFKHAQDSGRYLTRRVLVLNQQ